MSNTIKEEQCYYATYANSMGHPAEKECSNPLQDMLKIRILCKVFQYVKNTINSYQISKQNHNCKLLNYTL